MKRLCERLDALLDAPVRSSKLSPTCTRLPVMGPGRSKPTAHCAEFLRARSVKADAFPQSRHRSRWGFRSRSPTGFHRSSGGWGRLRCPARRLLNAAGEEWDRWLLGTVKDFLRHEVRFQSPRRDRLAYALGSRATSLAWFRLPHAAGGAPARFIPAEHRLATWSCSARRPSEKPAADAAGRRAPFRTGPCAEIGDPVQALKHYFRSAGVSEAGWRYVAHHGARVFRIPWSIHGATPRSNWRLSACGFSTTPDCPSSAAFHRRCALARAAGAAGRGVLPHVPRLPAFPPMSLRAGLLEADRRRRINRLGDFWVEFSEVCEWASPPLQFSGCEIMRWQLATPCACLSAEPGRRDRTVEFEAAALAVLTAGFRCRRPDDRTARVVRGSGPRGTGDAQLPRHLSGSSVFQEYEIYSVRDRNTRKSRACIGLFRRQDGKRFSVDQVKGYANRSPGSDVLHATQRLLRRLADLAGSGENHR